MEIAGVVSLDIQRDIIQALPEIINDEEHNFIAMELKYVVTLEIDKIKGYFLREGGWRIY